MSDQDFFFDEDEKPAKPSPKAPAKKGGATPASKPSGSSASGSAAPSGQQTVTMTVAVLVGVIGVLLGVVIGLFVGRSMVPPAVVTEICDLALPPSIQRAQLTREGAAYVRGAVGRLHAGELEVMVLAQERQVHHVALDDLLARNKAKQLGLIPIGTVGLLLLANTKGLVSAPIVKAKLQDLINRHGLYLSPRNRLAPYAVYRLAF